MSSGDLENRLIHLRPDKLETALRSIQQLATAKAKQVRNSYRAASNLCTARIAMSSEMQMLFNQAQRYERLAFDADYLLETRVPHMARDCVYSFWLQGRVAESLQNAAPGQSFSLNDLADNGNFF